MPLNIIVCIKQVPDPEHFDQITIDPKTGLIHRIGIPSITNPLDRHAIEEALRIKEAFGGIVTVLTMGPSQARKSIEEALAMGADRGAILCDQVFAGADTLLTAYVLSNGIRAIGNFDLILCGSETTDGGTGQVPPQLAEFLDIPHVTHARKIVLIDTKRVIAERTVENGYLKIELKLPALIAVLKSINQYRLPTVMGIMEATKKEIIEFGGSICQSSGMEKEYIGSLESPTKVIEIFEPLQRRSVEMIGGLPKEATRKLIKRLRDLEVLSR